MNQAYMEPGKWNEGKVVMKGSTASNLLENHLSFKQTIINTTHVQLPSQLVDYVHYIIVPEIHLKSQLLRRASITNRFTSL